LGHDIIECNFSFFLEMLSADQDQFPNPIIGLDTTQVIICNLSSELRITLDDISQQSQCLHSKRNHISLPVTS
jgi:hypothetical protein